MARTTGPKNTERTRLNALDRGFFAKTLVIKELGERKEDFDALKLSLNTYFAPSDPAQKMLVNDLVESRWLKDRIRRAENAEIRRTLLETNFGEDVSHEAYLSSLKTNFELLFVRLRSSSTRGKSHEQDRKAIESDLTTVRSRLEKYEWRIGVPQGQSPLRFRRYYEKRGTVRSLSEAAPILSWACR